LFFYFSFLKSNSTHTHTVTQQNKKSNVFGVIGIAVMCE